MTDGQVIERDTSLVEVANDLGQAAGRLGYGCLDGPVSLADR